MGVRGGRGSRSQVCVHKLEIGWTSQHPALPALQGWLAMPPLAMQQAFAGAARPAATPCSAAHPGEAAGLEVVAHQHAQRKGGHQDHCQKVEHHLVERVVAVAQPRDGWEHCRGRGRGQAGAGQHRRGGRLGGGKALLEVASARGALHIVPQLHLRARRSAQPHCSSSSSRRVKGSLLVKQIQLSHFQYQAVKFMVQGKLQTPASVAGAGQRGARQ